VPGSISAPLKMAAAENPIIPHWLLRFLEQRPDTPAWPTIAPFGQGAVPVREFPVRTKNLPCSGEKIPCYLS
jgi:hypothetical protein